MVGDYISREALRSRVDEIIKTNHLRPDYVWFTPNGVKVLALEIPAADVVEVRYCQFSLEEARRRESVYKCSACGYYLTVRADTLNGGRADMNYCPFCGRKVMHKWQDGGQDDV